MSFIVDNGWWLFWHFLESAMVEGAAPLLTGKMSKELRTQAEEYPTDTRNRLLKFFSKFCMVRLISFDFMFCCSSCVMIFLIGLHSIICNYSILYIGLTINSQFYICKHLNQSWLKNKEEKKNTRCEICIINFKVSCLYMLLMSNMYLPSFLGSSLFWQFVGVGIRGEGPGRLTPIF